MTSTFPDLQTELQDAEFRSAFSSDLSRSYIARQIRVVRTEQHLSTSDLARMMAVTKDVVENIEDPDCDTVLLCDLLKAASVMDSALLMKLVTLPVLMVSSKDVSMCALSMSPPPGPRLVGSNIGPANIISDPNSTHSLWSNSKTAHA